MDEQWKLEGYDTFSEESYSLSGNYPDRQSAEAAARKRLLELERTQPTSSSGGQDEHGIQDHVFVVRPDMILNIVSPLPLRQHPGSAMQE